jgi:pimeloyl-ACP methyl ester carboxylesterase
VLVGQRDAASLRSELRAVYDLLEDDDPERTMAHLGAAPKAVRGRIAEVSPARAAPDLVVPIVALHARDDPVIPYGELARLEVTYSQTEVLTLATFGHVGLGDEDESWGVTVRDLWTTARFVHRIIGA